MNLAFSLILAVTNLSLLALLKAYTAVSAREFKLRAREGDELAVRLYRASAYGETLAGMLWLVVVLVSALFFWTVAQAVDGWLAVPISAAFLWLGFIWLPARKVSHASLQLAAFMAPLLGWIASHMHALVEPMTHFLGRHLPGHMHTGLYDLNDLVGLLEEQQNQPDNRIDSAALTLARQAVTFGQRQVGDVMTPWSSVKMISATDVIGPVLMTELHDSGFSYFPVYEGNHENVVGMLSIRDLVDRKATGPVRQHMHAEVYNLQETQSLSETLEMVLQPNRHLFLVTDAFEEYVGVITAEDILKQIIGQPVGDELEQYQEVADIENGQGQDRVQPDGLPPTEEPAEMVK